MTLAFLTLGCMLHVVVGREGKIPVGNVAPSAAMKASTGTRCSFVCAPVLLYVTVPCKHKRDTNPKDMRADVYHSKCRRAPLDLCCCCCCRHSLSLLLVFVGVGVGVGGGSGDGGAGSGPMTYFVLRAIPRQSFARE